MTATGQNSDARDHFARTVTLVDQGASTVLPMFVPNRVLLDGDDITDLTVPGGNRGLFTGLREVGTHRPLQPWSVHSDITHARGCVVVELLVRPEAVTADGTGVRLGGHLLMTPVPELGTSSVRAVRVEPEPVAGSLVGAPQERAGALVRFFAAVEIRPVSPTPRPPLAELLSPLPAGDK